ncbi:uncharacterized protein LOC132271164 isoform X2 [Cornus florida]|uniref:uncharacterized protein LOC132271164 isoform X2 n=1 Tax=Cornus florida TaxID=4283 RepID=UPI00289CF978|nr:uncharacterized protein LOC132271164 isoform X2 [Cornus florida]
MAGNARFELTLGSPESSLVGNYPNGQRGNYPGPSLDRSGSFREVGESRIFGSGTGASRGSGSLTGDLPPLSQYLMLDPIMMGDQKYTRAGELRRVLGFSIGSAPEDNSFGAAHSKPPPPVAMDDLKRYKASVMDACIKARGRSKKLDEYLDKLNKYLGAINPKKQRDELLTNERTGGPNLKMGSQIRRNPPDLVTPRLEDRAKNVGVNKRVRTSLAESRPDCRSNGPPRQLVAMAKDRDILKDSGTGSDLVEKKIRRLPAGGEGWDQKLKRKSSVGTVFTRNIDSDGEFKRAMHHKLSNDPELQSCDVHSFRLGSSNATGINKSDVASSPASPIARPTSKNEQEKTSHPRDLTAGVNKERSLAKGSIKSSIREDNHVACPSIVTKGKASRTPRTGSAVVAANSSSNIPHVSGALESWEQPLNVNKIHSVGGANSRKRAMASGSSSPPMAQWGGRRPQKLSRTRRVNLVSPVSNIDEMQIPSDGCSPSDFGSRTSSGGISGSLFSRGMANGTQQFKVKHENASSPAGLSESEKSGSGENRLKEKGVGNGEVEEKAVNAVKNVGSSVMITKKNKLLTKEEIGDGVQRQGRSGRGSLFSRASISPIREKLENAGATKPLRSSRPGSDKNGSKSGRPLKKLLDRKAFSRLGHTPISSSPDLTESDDDREELLAAANCACNSSYLGNSPFWKKMEPIFAALSLEDISYLSQQLKFAEELQESLSQMFGHGNDILGDLHGETSAFDTLVAGERDRNLQNQVNSTKSARTVQLVDQYHGFDTLCGRLDSAKRFNKVTPLYQRVLSALIADDEIEDFEGNDLGRDAPLHCDADASPDDVCLPIDPEHKKRDITGFDCESVIDVQVRKEFTANRLFSCNGSTNCNESLQIQNIPCNDKLLNGDGGFVHSEVGMLVGLSRNDLDGPQNTKTDDFSIPSFDCKYEQMCLDDKVLLELQSIGLYPETVPDLDDREDEMVNQEIIQLKNELYLQIGKKKGCLDQINNAIQRVREIERRDLEQVAMNKLVELAYKKLLATRGSIASKLGVAKVSKQVALAFAKRTLARCQKFEDSGTSCFSEPALRTLILDAPHRGNDAEPLISVGAADSNNKHLESHNARPDAMASGSFPSAAEWHDLHNKIDRGSLDGFETFAHHSDQAFVRNGPTSNRGKKKEVLLDDVGGIAALRATSTLDSTLPGGTKGRRSERERDKDQLTRNAVGKAGRLLPGNVKGERKTKTKPKQKTAQLSTSGSGFISKSTETTHPVYPSAGVTGELVMNTSNRRKEVRLMSSGNNPQNSSKEIKEQMDLPNMQLHELDPLEDLGVSSDLGAPQDFNTWFNFDEDGLQDHDSMGLEIPMDDLSELNMF